MGPNFRSSEGNRFSSIVDSMHIVTNERVLASQVIWISEFLENKVHNFWREILIKFVHFNRQLLQISVIN